MANKYSGFGVLFKTQISSVYTTVAGVLDIKGPNISLTQIDVTSRDSANWMEFIGGLKDGGEVTFSLIYDPATQTQSASASGGLLTLLGSGSTNNFQLYFPSSNTFTFAGLVTKFAPTAPLNDKLTADVTIKVSGAVTFA